MSADCYNTDYAICFPFRNIYHVLSLPDVGRSSPHAKIYFNSPITRRSHSIQRQYRIWLKCAAKHSDDTYSEEEKVEHISKANLIWRAIKLPMYSVALIPIAVSYIQLFLCNHLEIAQTFFKILIRHAYLTI